MQFVQCLWLEVCVEKKILSHLKTPETVAMKTKVCHVIKLWTSFQKLNCRLFIQEEHGFQKGAQCAPLPQEQKKKLGLDRVKW